MISISKCQLNLSLNLAIWTRQWIYFLCVRWSRN